MEVHGSDPRTQAPAPAPVVRKLPPWHYVYFLLAGLNLLTLSASLYGQRGLSRVYRDTVAVGQQGEQRSAQYVRLGQLAKALQTAGHRVVTAQDPDTEAARARQAFAAFLKELDQARHTLKDDPALAQLLLRRQLDALHSTMITLMAEADRVFGQVAAAHSEQARESLRRVDRVYGELTVGLFTLQSDAHVIWREHFTQHGAQTTSLTQQHAVVSGALTLLVVLATLYGYRLYRQETAAEQETARYLTALERSEGRLQRIVSSVPQSVLFQYRQTAEGAGAFCAVSPRAAQVLGLDASVTFNTPARLAELIHPEDRAAFAHSLAESARRLQAWRWEGRMVTGAGTVKWVQGSATPARHANREIVWDGLFVDNSEQKQREEDLRQSEERSCY